MTGDPAGFRIGIAELAILGLLFPAECNDLPVWSGEEREIFRRASMQILVEGENIDLPAGCDRDALTEAEWIVNTQDLGWWPCTWVKIGCGCKQVHDLTLPLLWGI